MSPAPLRLWDTQLHLLNTVRWKSAEWVTRASVHTWVVLGVWATPGLSPSLSFLVGRVGTVTLYKLFVTYKSLAHSPASGLVSDLSTIQLAEPLSRSFHEKLFSPFLNVKCVHGLKNRTESCHGKSESFSFPAVSLGFLA